MRRRRRSSRLAGLGPDATIGLSMLVAGVGFAWFLYKFNTPSQDDIAKSMAGLGCGTCGHRE